MDNRIKKGRTLGAMNRSDPMSVPRNDPDFERSPNSPTPMGLTEKRVVYEDVTESGSVKEELTLSVAPPVKGFDAVPRFTCKIMNGEIVMDPTTKYQFVWFRSRKHYLCASDNCINRNKRRGNVIETKYQCLTCLQYGNERHSYFCSPECLVRGWKTHCLTHKITPESTVHSERKLPLQPHTTVDELADLQLKQLQNQRFASEGWDKVSMDIHYHPGELDVGHILRCSVLDSSNRTILSYDSLPVAEPPGYASPRQWISLPLANRPAGIPLTITSYNMLADLYCQPDLYSQCPLWALEWTYRRDRLIKQLNCRNSDIFCLQEIEKGEYEEFWAPEMEKRGYLGVFTVKTRLFMGSDDHVDGCATFYNASKFQLLAQFPILFNASLESQLQQNFINQEQYKRLKRGTVSHILHFSTIPAGMGVPENGIQFVLVNCHLFWDPTFPDVKLEQAYELMSQLQRVVRPAYLPVIICGDFNSEPSSVVYEFMASGKVSMDHPDLRNDPEFILRNIGIQNIRHDFALRSSYASVMGREPQYTNYTDHYTGCLDYIWVSRSIIPVGVSVLPSEDEILSCGELKLPNPKYPSDHLALDCSLILTS